MIQYINFVFDPIFDNRILGVYQRVRNILFTVREIDIVSYFRQKAICSV